MNNMLRESFADLATIVGEGIGDLLSGLDFDGTAIIETLSKFAGQFGKLLVAIGIAKIEFLKGIAGDPFTLIAAGVALIALSKIATNLLSNPTGSSSGVGTSGGYKTSTQNIQLGAVIKGEDIYMSNQRTSERYQRIGVGG